MQNADLENENQRYLYLWYDDDSEYELNAMQWWLKIRIENAFISKTNHYSSSSASMVPGSLIISAMASNVFFLLLGSWSYMIELSLLDRLILTFFFFFWRPWSWPDIFNCTRASAFFNGGMKRQIGGWSSRISLLKPLCQPYISLFVRGKLALSLSWTFQKSSK